MSGLVGVCFFFVYLEFYFHNPVVSERPVAEALRPPSSRSISSSTESTRGDKVVAQAHLCDSRITINCRPFRNCPCRSLQPLGLASDEAGSCFCQISRSCWLIGARYSMMIAPPESEYLAQLHVLHGSNDTSSPLRLFLFTGEPSFLRLETHLQGSAPAGLPSRALLAYLLLYRYLEAMGHVSITRLGHHHPFALNQTRSKFHFRHFPEGS